MKIAIITLHGVWNYGSVLQSLATQTFFRELGMDVEFINYKRDDFRTISGFLYNACKGHSLIKALLKAAIYWPTVMRWKYVFGSFLKKNITVSKYEYITKDDFRNHIPDAEVYCTGSDQVWNSKLNGGLLQQFFLDFVPEGKKKISFAASFGKDRLDEWEVEETCRLLKRYDYITVRESNGVSICHELGIERVHQILDPTLLHPRDFWMNYVGKRPVKDDYLLVYQLHKEEGVDNYLKELAQRRNLKIVRVCYRYDELRKLGHPILIPTVDKLLSAIYYASLIVTDSFHITAFSTNFKKDFISVVPAQQFGSRISSLLTLTGLQARSIHRFDDFSPLSNEIDWHLVDEVYVKERENTKNFFGKLMMEYCNDV